MYLRYDVCHVHFSAGAECLKTTMMYMTAAVPARFLILVSHLVLTIIVVLARVSSFSTLEL